MLLSITGKTVLVTRANRGLGRSLVDEALSRGAKRVYVGARQPFTHPDERVVPLILDVTDSAQIQEAVDEVGSLDPSLSASQSLTEWHNMSDRGFPIAHELELAKTGLAQFPMGRNAPGDR